MSSDPFADWYSAAVTVTEPPSYGEAGDPMPGALISVTRGQMGRSSQLVRNSDGVEVVSSATLAIAIGEAEFFKPGRVVTSSHGAQQIIRTDINDADPELAGATVYLS